MNRYFHLVLITFCAFVTTALLIVGAGNLTPAHSAGVTIKVPDDYGTIQEAVDAAADGDTIMVKSGTYDENLSITEGITLTGGWNEDFSARTLGSSVIDGQELGRVISITCATSDTVVIVDGFKIVNGAGSGLGTPLLPVTAQASSLLSAVKLEYASDYVSGRASMLQASAADLNARGVFPGGQQAYQAALTRMDELTGRILDAPNMPADLNAPAVSADGGGGIYSWNASLHLLNSTVEWNTASQSNNGYGGGVFVGQSALGGTVIADNMIQFNTASVEANGSGGGLYLYQAPGTLVEGNQFRDNVASQSGDSGAGGGLNVDESQDVWIDDNLLTRNTAHAGWECPDQGGGGIGGGAQFRSTKSLTITNNVLRSNLGALHCGSSGGGMHVYIAEDVYISDNQLVDNWGVLFQVYTDDYGGGMSLETIEGVTVAGNEVRGNTTSMSSLPSGIQLSYGGGIFGYMLNDGEFLDNTFSGNVASFEMKGYGGGIFLEGSTDDVLSDNTITDNTASLLGEGSGGGMLLRDTVGAQVQHNRFNSNRGSAESIGYGGGLSVESYGPHSFDTRMEGNLFLQNQASADPGEFSEGGAAAVVTHGFEFNNNVVAGNSASEGSGLSMHLLGETEKGEITNNTFNANGGTGVLVDVGNTPVVSFTNNIIVDHTTGISVTESMTAVVRYTLWNGNGTDTGGSGVISETHPVSGDPAFVDSAAHDYHLTGASAAFDAGDPAGVPPAPPEDLDGVERPQFSAVDIGAYEWGGEGFIYLPFVTRDVKPYIGWAVGESDNGFGTILFTQDGGANWIRQGSSEDVPDVNLTSVFAVDACTAWAVGGRDGGYGVIMHTADGGETWVRQGDTTQIPDVATSVVHGVNKQTAWVVGGDGVILNTMNGGESWKRQDQSTIPIYPLTGVYASDASHVWAVGGITGTCPENICGIIIRSEDGGNSWEQLTYVPNPEALGKYLIFVHGSGDNNIWIVGNGTVQQTTDGGDTWQDLTPGISFFDYNGVFAVNENSVWVSRDADGIFKYDGNDWDTQTSPKNGFYNLGISALDNQTAWLVGRCRPPCGEDLGIIYHTATGGEIWESQTPGTDTGLRGVSFVSGGYCYPDQ